MRIRSIKPAYWDDPDLQLGLKADTREFYIGLWMLADDAGWIDWEPRRVGAELYPYKTVPQRLVLVERHSKLLSELTPEHPHLVFLPCGHAVIPKLTRHQQVGGKPVYTVRRQHEERCTTGNNGEHRGDTGAPRSSHDGRVGKGEVSNGGERGGTRMVEVVDGRLRKVDAA